MKIHEYAAIPLGVGARLPTLSDAAGRPVWRPQYTRSPVVLAILHADECGPCSLYRDQLMAARADFAAWDGRLAVVAPAAMDAPPDVLVVRDDFGAAPRIVVADRFGDVYHVEEGGAAHALPGPRVLEEWLRFIATQCPE
jgi:hypothetical protein